MPPKLTWSSRSRRSNHVFISSRTLLNFRSVRPSPRDEDPHTRSASTHRPWIDSVHRQLTHVSLRWKRDQPGRGYGHELTPGITVERQQHAIARLHIRNARSDGEDEPDAFVPDNRGKFWQIVKGAANEKQVVVVDGSKLGPDQSFTRSGGGGSGRSIISKRRRGCRMLKVEWRACWMVRWFQ